mmetsp:Transcript_29563/g.68390  ORF Transcript_29563/g.68390 Transcript_29563/m.68390 type:complete len:109 (+) Transcript_29563:678-1004(+)
MRFREVTGSVQIAPNQDSWKNRRDLGVAFLLSTMIAVCTPLLQYPLPGNGNEITNPGQKMRTRVPVRVLWTWMTFPACREHHLASILVGLYNDSGKYHEKKSRGAKPA